MKKIFLVITSAFLLLSVNAQTYRAGQSKKDPLQELNDIYCTGLFKSSDGTILDVANNNSAKAYLNIIDWLPGRVSGLTVFTTSMGVSVPMIRNTVPGIYVDEIPVSLSYLSNINVSDIAMVKIIKTPFYGGFNSGGGAIAIYTLGGEDE